MAASKSLALGGKTDGFGAFLIVAIAYNERLFDAGPPRDRYR